MLLVRIKSHTSCHSFEMIFVTVNLYSVHHPWNMILVSVKQWMQLCMCSSLLDCSFIEKKPLGYSMWRTLWRHMMTSHSIMTSEMVTSHSTCLKSHIVHYVTYIMTSHNVQYVISDTYYVTSSFLTSSCAKERMLMYHDGREIEMPSFLERTHWQFSSNIHNMCELGLFYISPVYSE